MEFFLKIYDHSDYETRDQNLTIYNCYIYIKLIIKLLNIIYVSYHKQQFGFQRVQRLYTRVALAAKGSRW